MQRIGMIDLDGYTSKKKFPNLPLMKLSAWHKKNGDDVSWYDGSHYDKVYASKVFSFSPNFNGTVNADEVIYGGSGFAIRLQDGKEIYNKNVDNNLPYEIEHIYPDYSLYGITDTVYGFMSRGCPRGCDFCHVKNKEGRKSVKVADLAEFWGGQKYIEIMDPNTFACEDWKDILNQLKDSGATISFNQGIDIRIMTEEKLKALMELKTRIVHMAWDRYEDGKYIKPKLQMFKDVTGWGRQKVEVYVLTNFNTTFEQDLERVMYIRSLGFQPFVMRYDKEHIPRGHKLNSLARWTNFIPLFWKFDTFDEYMKNNRNRIDTNDDQMSLF